MTVDEDRRAGLERVAAELAFTVDEETLDRSLDAVEGLERTAETLETPPVGVTDEGVPGADPYNAYLAVYEEPRRRDPDQNESTNGVCEGLTVAVKDNIAVRGLEMTCGSAQFSVVPSSDATLVARLLDTGAAISGKTNMDAFAFGPSGEFSDFGRVENPIDAERVPGGSSSGSGAVVAAGLADAALGSDTGGSIRMPAACCGIVGAKPSHRLVPRDGFVDFAPTLDAVGPLAKDVETAARVLEAIKGHTPADPSTSRVKTDSFVGSLDIAPAIRFGVLEPYVEQSDPVVVDAFRDLTSRLDARDGVTVDSVPLDTGEVQNAYFLTATTEFAWLYRQNGVVRGQGTGYDEEIRAALAGAKEGGFESQHVAWRVLPSAFLDANGGGKAYAAARREVARFERELAAVFERVDLLLTPTIRGLPPTYGEMGSPDQLMNLLGNTSPFNLTGMPGVSVPIDESDGLPISAQVVGPVFDDRLALQGARLVERLAAT